MVTEVCPDCDNEVELKDEMRMQVCPVCGRDILPCALCDMDNVDCGKCTLEQWKKLPLREQVLERPYANYEFVDKLDEIEISRARKMEVLDLIEKYFLS